jgi:thiamine-phosphate pyrophosphorylase
MIRNYFNYGLYVISDSVEILSEAVSNGVRIIQLRDKNADINSIKSKTREIIALKKTSDFLFILNDYPECAHEIGADGVHVGQENYTVEQIRVVAGNNFLIGRSTHSIEQGIAAQLEGADYISVGPINATPTKPGREAVGSKYIEQAVKNISIPFVVIGGIDLSNIREYMDLGGKTFAVVRAVNETKELMKILSEYRPS